MSIALILANKGSEIVSILPQKTMRDAADLLHRHKIGAVMVMGVDGALLGILSERDIVSSLAREGGNALDNPVSRHMTSAVKTASEKDTIEQTMERMTVGRFRHLPVLRDNQVIGIVSIGDIVKHRLEAMENEHRALKDYISSA
jgi:CBS domain-containing protein